MIFDAAYAAIRDHGDASLSVSDILTAASVSTRSFYRHFQSKDDLLCAMYRCDAVRAAERLVQRLQRASSPVEAVGTWIDEIISFREVVPKAERVTLLGSIVANRADGSERVAREARALLTAPLSAAVAAGAAIGDFASNDPEQDAAMVAAVVFDAAGLSAPHPPSPSAPCDRDAVHTFCFRALGANRPDQ